MNTRSADRTVVDGKSAAVAHAPRQAWIDVARAVALVLVVAGHTERGLVAAGIMTGEAAQDFDLVVYSFHIPLFFLISGLLFAQSIRRRPFVQTWKARTIRLLQPCLIWSVVLLGLIVLAANLANTPVSPADAFTSFLLLPFQPVSIFWFLYTLVLCMAVSGLVIEYRLCTAGQLLFWSMVLHLVYLLFLSDRQSGMGLHFIRFAEHQIYFALGIFFAQAVQSNGSRKAADEARSGKYIAIAVIFMAACFLAAATALVGYHLSYHSLVGTVAALSASSVVLGACYLAVSIRKFSVPGPVMTISKETLAIFCMHVPFVSGTRIALSHLGIDVAVLHLLSGTVIGIFGPLLALKLLDNLGLAAIAGFASEQRAQPFARQP
ncbi:acyltransferase family protein [Pararhizobium sp. PWRC1-1]|uniref:acyltransferase family protein n=1 Tax=Pararhizobium sp. PWRC1-1 TaxID=2804566 RepID=UPI003CED42CA